MQFVYLEVNIFGGTNMLVDDVVQIYEHMDLLRADSNNKHIETMKAHQEIQLCISDISKTNQSILTSIDELSRFMIETKQMQIAEIAVKSERKRIMGFLIASIVAASGFIGFILDKLPHFFRGG